jgi:hypothetical protein
LRPVTGVTKLNPSHISPTYAAFPTNLTLLGLMSLTFNEQHKLSLL